MSRLSIFLLTFGMVLMFPSTVYAQWGVDGGRAFTIAKASAQAEKTLKSQLEVQKLQTVGHLWTKEEIEATTEFQREFNDYLDAFHNILSIAAEIYGVYYEVTKTSKHVRNLAEVVMDIRKVCIESSKMTEQEKNKVISAIRPKLRKINHQLGQLTLALRYTSFLDVWNEISHRSPKISREAKIEIIKRSRREWWDNAKSVR